ncbi:hydrogen peroxide-inducible genes activator [Lacihabitans lacunae]|uniref:LysR substrate-binding domain-containing protein n=1 Tax=Lacihabitans lacunae TaxID=1028214 RepID=A0ABV7YYE4_9BACT
MSITQLAYILAVEKYRNFVEAAETCHVSQPALSMQIKKLEEHLNIQIFDRSQSPVTVTAIGQKVLAKAKQTLTSFNQIYDLVLEESNGLAGEVKLGVIPTVAPYLLPLFLKKLNADFPDVSLIVEELTTQKIIEGLHNGELDLGILATPLHIKNLKEHHLYFEELKVYVSAENKLFEKKYILSEDIDLNYLWLLEEGHCLRTQIANFCELKQKQNIVSQLNFKTGSLETIIKLVDKYRGITLIPDLVTLDMTDAQKSKVRRFDGPKPQREISLVCEASYPRKTIVEALKGAILACLPTDYLSETKQKVLEIY